jgi:hypothetical protein
MTTRRKLLTAGMLAAPAAFISKQGFAAKGGGTAGQLSAPVTGTFTNAAGLGSVAGTFVIDSFTVVGNSITAVGDLIVRVTDALGNVLGIVRQALTLVTTIGQSTCTVLELHIGAISLSLLGLNVNLAPIDLVITANPAGGLLGQLLCALAGGGAVQNLVNLLNQLLALFAPIA